MLGDDPPYLSVGTEVSAKYKGAFCEAKIRKVVRSVKCRVTYKQGLGTATVADDQIKGTLRVGASVEARHGDRKEFVEATITKIQDCSQYTVVFDDGDITTLRRTALCLKSGRHFAESETLDQLPLTHPEHFGNPVIGGRRGRRSRQAQDESSEDEDSPPRGTRDSGSSGNGKEGMETEPEIGRVVCVELGDKKKKDNWFPGLVVAPTAQDTVRIRVRDDYLVRSFKDARYYTVPKKEATEFTKELVNKVENSTLKVAVEKALLFLEKNELPPHWDRDSLFGHSVSSGNSDSDGELDSDSSDDEPREEKDHFVAQLYKFMDDRGTPINNCPMIGSEDIDLYRLFRAVYKLGGYNRVTNQNQWKLITRRLSFTMQNSPSTHNLVKQAYKKFLHSFEDFYRKLGCTMVNHPRGSTRKQRPGRSLIRDKDRNTPIPPQVTATKTEKEEEEKKVVVEEEKKEKKEIKKEPPPKEEEVVKIKKKEEFEESGSGQESDVNIEVEGESSSSEKSQKMSMQLTPLSSRSKSKSKEDPKKKTTVEKKKTETKKQERKDEKTKEEDAAKTRSKSKDDTAKGKTSSESSRESRTPSREADRKTVTKQRRLTDEEMKRRGRKRKEYETEKSRSEEQLTEAAPCYKGPVELGDRLKVYYGPTHESKVTYEAKVIDMEKDGPEPMYLVHYTGWNTRYDEWIKASRIAQNFTQAQGRVKRIKATPRPQTPSTNLTNSTVNNKSSQSKSSGSTSTASQSRRRAQSVAPTTSVASSTSTKEVKKDEKEPSQPARSTTPLSVASSSSRTKSPATPANSRQTRTTRSNELSGTETHRRRTRRMSGHTDISVASETEEDSEAYDSDTTEPEQTTRTRSKGTDDRGKRREGRSRAEERMKPDETSEGEDEKDGLEEPRRGRRLRRTLGKSQGIKSEPDSDEEQPKGRDFDLNQIRSELKGFDKAVKLELVRVEPDPEDEEVKTEEKENLVVATAATPTATPTPTAAAAAAAAATTASLVSPKLEKAMEPVKLETTTPETKPVDNTEDIYEFKEPEPFEFEVRNKRDTSGEKEKPKKRVFEEEPKSPKKKQRTSASPVVKEAKQDPENETRKKAKKLFASKRTEEAQDNVHKPVLTPATTPTTNSEDTFEKTREPSPFNQLKPSPIVEETGKITTSIDLLFSDLPGDDDGTHDDSEDRLIISETEVSEPEQENLFTYQQEMFPVAETNHSIESEKEDSQTSQEESVREELPMAIPVVKAETVVEQKQAVKSSPLHRQSPELRTVETKLLDVTPVVSAIVAAPAPISARLPATSTIEEKLSAAAMAFRNKTKEAKKEEDEAPRKAVKEPSKKLDVIVVQRTKEEPSLPKAEVEIKKREVEEDPVQTQEEEHCRDILRVVMKQKEDDQPKVKKDTTEMKQFVEVKIEHNKKSIQDSRMEEWKNVVDEGIKKMEEDYKPMEKEKRKRQEKLDTIDSADSSDSEQRLVIDNEESQDVKPTSNFDAKLRAELDRLHDAQDSRYQKVQTSKSSVHMPQSQPQLQQQLQPQSQPHLQLQLQPQQQLQPQLQQQLQLQPHLQPQQQLQPHLQLQPQQQLQPQLQPQMQQQLQPQMQQQLQLQLQLQLPQQQQQQPESMAEFNKQEPISVTKTDEEGEAINSLLCEEEIPGSPAPPTESVEQTNAGPSCSPPKIDTTETSIVLMEMPFASAPTSGQSTTSSSTVATLSMSLAKTVEASVPVSLPVQQNQPLPIRQQQQQQQPSSHHQHLPALMPAQRRESNEAAPVMDNTPPTTPDSSISNISGSPREERTGGSSPTSEDNLKRDSSEADNDSACKGGNQAYSEDDTIPNSEGNSADRMLKPPAKRAVEDSQSPKKRKRNRKHSECGSTTAPKKQPGTGRHSGRHGRHGGNAGSDSDDTSEGSNLCGVNAAAANHTNIASVPDLSSYSSRSPRPTKYNFYVELDPELDGSQRIAVLQQKLTELRKTYNAVKVELAAIERRRKKLRRREREAIKAAKAEMQQACS